MSSTIHDHGFDLLLHPSTNKSTAFTLEERERFGLRGLLPAQVSTMERQKERVLENLRRKAYDIERYIALQALQNRNERLYYRALIDHIDELMPIVYTPTVGQACREFAHIFRQPRGFYVTPSDKGAIRQNLDNWPEPEVRVVVVTDGERILGLGDLGANGMGIPIGKLALYTACAGIAPEHCLPVMLDVGTNNEELLDDPLYLGVPERRVRGEHYDDLVEELITALADKWPHALIQFEDFLTPNAYRLLQRYRDRVFCFNDDIQGTAAVALAGVLASTRITGLRFEDLRIMFLGAGSAATGIADLTANALVASGLSRKEAVRRLSFVDLHGLLVASRTDLQEHNLPYAHDDTEMGFIDALHNVRPHVLIGATGAPGTFTREIVETMAEINERPVIFALSNPTSRAECTAEQAYSWSGGRAVFASGSPFGSVEFEGRLLRPGQGNNAYIFPGIGLGAVACQAERVSEPMFLAAARTLASQVTQAQLDEGTLYPPLSEIRRVSAQIALAVASEAYADGLARLPAPENLQEYILGQMYEPSYRSEEGSS
ncbi:MAG: NAD-dependent malic enzyme [Thermoanaerobaculia bacterium]|nr:NAD-dependent malic enzyme [Thermoanaerobaculia bacterium]